MSKIVIALGGVLIGWGIFVLATGDYVATLDIAAGLVAAGVVSIALGAVIATLERIAGTLGERGVRDEDSAPAPALAPAPAPIPAAMPSAVPLPAPPARKAPRALPEAAPSPQVAPEAGPVLVREGEVEGRHYRFYSDGSIEAEGPNGLRRYRSMDEAREDILRARTRPPRTESGWESFAPAGSRGSAESRPDAYAPPPAREPRLARETPREPPPAPASLEDDEWSEPFRMLLRGDSDSPLKPPKR